MRVVLDTNVLVAAIRSKVGASYALLTLIETSAFDHIVTVPLVLEYEEQMLLAAHETGYEPRRVQDIVDYVCATGIQAIVHFTWRPQLNDPDDEIVLDAAVAGAADAIVTYNLRDVERATRFGFEVMTPGQLLARLRGAS